MKSKSIVVVLVAVVALSFGGYFLYKYQTERNYTAMTETDLFAKGQVAISKRQLGKAVTIFKTLLEKDPKHTVAMRFLVDAQQMNDDIAGAVETLEKLVKLDKSPKHKARLEALRKVVTPQQKEAVKAKKKD